MKEKKEKEKKKKKKRKKKKRREKKTDRERRETRRIADTMCARTEEAKRETGICGVRNW